MGTFEDFIRYGLPGYILLGSIVSVLTLAAILPINYDIYKDFANIVGATILVVGPLIGFIIHQLYLVFFDWKESYTKLSRGCIAFIYIAFLQSDQAKTLQADENLVKDQSFIAWKFLTTNFEKDFKIDSLFINRLRSLRNYSHSFGSIATSSILSILTGAVVFALSCTKPLGIIIYFATHLVLISLFYGKRRELLRRINEMEIGIVLKHKVLFIDYMAKLTQLELDNRPILSLIRK